MKYALTMTLAMAAVIVGQTALALALDFHTAEQIGKTALMALYLYAVIRMSRARRGTRA